MPDREKVITDAEEAIKILGKVDEPTFWLDFVRVAVENALKLLKGQEPLVRCKDCKNAEILSWLDNAIICKKHNYTGARPDEFYCADGERR